MAKSKKRKQFRDFESSAIREDYKEPYISLTKSMLTNENWLSLNYPSQVIYIQMKLWSYGRQEFSFSYNLAMNIFKSRTTFKKAIDELVNKGFLEITKISKKPGIGTTYKFSNKWYMKW